MIHSRRLHRAVLACAFSFTITCLATTIAQADAANTGPSTATPATQPALSEAVTLPRATQFDVTSSVGKPYRIFIAEPSPDGSIAAPANGYAVMVVLDANAMFFTAVDAVRFQRGQTPAIVVGIGYPADVNLDIQRRYYDFSPVTPPEHIWSSGTSPRAKPEQTGGEDVFLDLIEQTVLPEVAKRYPIDHTRKAIVGHSLAGRLVLHTLFTRPQLFSHYVAISPSIWWNDRSILREAETFQQSRATDASPVSLLMTVGEFEQTPAPGTAPERVEFFKFAKMVDNARDLAESLKTSADKNVAVTFVEYPDENHGSIVPVTFGRAAAFALKAPPAPAKESTTKPAKP